MSQFRTTVVLRERPLPSTHPTPRTFLLLWFVPHQIGEGSTVKSYLEKPLPYRSRHLGESYPWVGVRALYTFFRGYLRLKSGLRTLQKLGVFLFDLEPSSIKVGSRDTNESQTHVVGQLMSSFSTVAGDVGVTLLWHDWCEIFHYIRRLTFDSPKYPVGNLSGKRGPRVFSAHTGTDGSQPLPPTENPRWKNMLQVYSTPGRSRPTVGSNLRPLQVEKTQETSVVTLHKESNGSTAIGRLRLGILELLVENPVRDRTHGP